MHDTLRAYLESAYHIRNRSLISERRYLLQQVGFVTQEPYVESTPSYKIGRPYSAMSIPDAAKEVLTEIASFSPGVGVFPRPYQHQTEALEAFLGSGHDIVVATGTGSGKTESFLMPILGSLAIEAAQRSETASLHGCRAILLYPMNALVNDQLGRIRKLFGDERVAAILRRGRNRPVRFGSYTSRTPYPGERTPNKDNAQIAPLFERFYLKHPSDHETVARLREAGKWPSKDLVGFFGKNKEEKSWYQTGQRKGKPFVRRHWNERLITQPDDRELLTRHEMHERCPDILITNYSMLEYMLMRPIERQIFHQTKEWLEADERNHLVLVLDEAHMYRGTGGAEVALLIRRLMARLGISRNRLRCILTSASLGSGVDAEQEVLEFSRELTGLPATSQRKMHLVKGVREERGTPSPGTPDEARSLELLDLGAFQLIEVDTAVASQALSITTAGLGWPPPPTEKEDLADYLFSRLTDWGPAELLIQTVSGTAVRLHELAHTLFPTVDEMTARNATESLIALGTCAKRKSDGRILLPTRLHLFYRGLPGLYACTDPSCTERFDRTPPEQPVLGRLHLSPRLHCTCKSGARVFELLTHRDCGTAFLRAFVRGDEATFLLHEPAGLVGIDDTSSEKLYEVQMLVDGQPHCDALGDCAEAWLDIVTGHIIRQEPDTHEGYLKVFLPVGRPGSIEKTFQKCPVCLRKWASGRSKIMDLATKGEAPFANLVKSQLFVQPPKREENLDHPNGGRKVLLFSDGRQKAARLARDIPREVEWDTFRQAIALAAMRYRELKGRHPKPNRSLYAAFVSVVSQFNLQLFDGDDRKALMVAVSEFRDTYGSSLDYALENEWPSTEPPPGYYRALLRQLCSAEFSLRAATVGYVKPAPVELPIKDLQSIAPTLTPEYAESLAVAFIQEMLADFAFETEKVIAPSVRQEAAGHPQKSWASEGKLSDAVRAILQHHLGCTSEHVDQVQSVLRRKLCHPSGSAFVVKGNSVVLYIDTDAFWYRCTTCTYLSPVTLVNRCVNCGSQEVETLDPTTSDYIQARKGFLRDPVIHAIRGVSRPKHVTVEEHTAQLSQRDTGIVFATTEKYELRFQDVIIGEDEGPIDVLSCTTTMEVGIDIGALVAVGLRNVPPQRENYQQRAGRAGRRGSAVSTVITYAQGGPHDSHYFHHPTAMVAGPPRMPVVKTDNPKIAERHVHSYLVQTFFHEQIDEGRVIPSGSSKLMSVLGTVSDFFSENADNAFSLGDFERWVHQRVLAPEADLLESVVAWLPGSISQNRKLWVRQVARDFIDRLKGLRVDAQVSLDLDDSQEEPEGIDEDPVTLDLGDSRNELLSFLFDHGLLPSYAFPTSLCSFSIEDREPRKGGFKVIVKERPQQSIDKALSEYAPGRLIVVDKVTYRSGGITASSSTVTDPDRAAPLFRDKLRPYVACKRCTFVQDKQLDERELLACPVCTGELDKGDLLIPEVFHPEDGKPVSEVDRDQDITYATSAQFPVPLDQDDLHDLRALRDNLFITHARDRRLVMVNKGDKETNAGFAICAKCGAASMYDPVRPRHGWHSRPYDVEPRFGKNVSQRCDGQFRRVYLGHTFLTDLLVLRSFMEAPLVRDIQHSVQSSALNDALRTISEALVLGASSVMDVDPAEFQSGYRLFRTGPDQPLRADIYLFDTLSGGAGYAEQAGQEIERILNETLKRLQTCPSGCDRSCTECLRHYQNRFWHMDLDRHLGAALLRYMLKGQLPAVRDAGDQANQLQALIRLLQLDGHNCVIGSELWGVQVPLIVTGGLHRLAVGTYSPLLHEGDAHYIHPLTSGTGREAECYLINEYILTRNLPLAYHRVKSRLEA